MAGHLLVLEDAARILAVTRRTVRTVAERNAVRRAQTAEAPALHRTGKALALRVAGDVDLLPGDEVLGTDGRTDRHQAFLVLNAELGDLHLQRHFRLRESFALRLVHVLLLGLARTDLKREVAVAIGGAVRNDLAVFQSENGHGHVPAILLEQAGHPDFLCDNAGAHRKTPKTEAPPAHPEVRDSPGNDASPRPG